MTDIYLLTLYLLYLPNRVLLSGGREFFVVGPGVRTRVPHVKPDLCRIPSQWRVEGKQLLFNARTTNAYAHASQKVYVKNSILTEESLFCGLIIFSETRYQKI